jgi:two-component sensor histidine kinase
LVLGTLERWRRKRKLGYGFAVIAFLAAFALRYGLDDWLPPGLPFLTFFPAVILTSFFASLRPAIVVTVLSGLAAWYFFLPPFESFAVNPAKLLALLFFAIVAAIIILLVHTLNVAIDRLRDERAKAQTFAQQRETMFSELQHRISNNLQLVAALLALDTAQLTDTRAKAALAEASRRLTLIGKLHRQLYDPKGAEIDFGQFLKQLCDDVVKSWSTSKVDCFVRAQAMTLAADQSIPVALIVMELMSNSMEHGFKNKNKGTININARRADGNAIILEVTDDGDGLPPGFKTDGVKSLGLRIVQTLTEQLAGRFEMQSERGTTCRIILPEKSKAPPVLQQS